MIVLDTHVLLWAAGDDRRLGRKARALIKRTWSAGEVAVPTIAFWETGLLQARGRVRLSMPVTEWRQALLAAGIVELPLDGSIAVPALELTGLHDDPADRFIAATAVVHGATLVTADERLLAWRHPSARQDARL
jgi:PIN domain nuclease of toxin-antitoxin system